MRKLTDGAPDARRGRQSDVRRAGVEALEGRLLMAAGFLDPSFGGDGRVVRASGSGGAVAVQPDGKIVTAGAIDAPGGGFDFLVARYNADGSPDASFGQGGIARTDFAGASDIARAVALQPDGKIVVAGSAGRDFAVARYHANGTPDNTFGGDGLVTTPFGISGAALDLAIQADGKIVAVGSASEAPGESTFALVRYTSDGGLDPLFATGGKVTTGFGLTAAYAVAIGPGGTIVAGGTADTNLGDAALARYNPDGSLDPSFGPFPDEDGSGIPGINSAVFEAFDEYDEIRDVAVDTDGSIVAAGMIEGRGFTVGRVAVEGFLEHRHEAVEFAGGPGGGASRSSVATAVAFDADRRVLAAGYTTDANGQPENFALARFNADGVVDRTFGFRGAAVTDFRPMAPGTAAPDPPDSAASMTLGPGGAIVVAGASNTNGAVARYLGAGDTAPPPITVTADNVLALDGTAGADDVRLYPWTELAPRFAADVNGSLFLAPRGVGKARIDAGPGDDAVAAVGGFAFPMYVIGGDGRDSVTGGAAGDVLHGNAGNDVLDGGRGSDMVIAGDGDDVILASETGAGLIGSDYYLGGPGFDTVDYSSRAARLSIRLGLFATSTGASRERDTIRDVEGAVGGTSADRIEGNQFANRLEGGGGNDVLIGRAGNDTLLGGAGDDVLTDTVGANALDGGAGVDTINGVRDSVGEVLLEAENATLVGPGVARANSGYTGTGYADFGNTAGQYAEWTFENTAGPGPRTLTFRYANGSTENRPLELRVNGALISPTEPFAPTGTWTQWRTVTFTVQLMAGANRIRLTSLGRGPNVDWLTIA